MKNILIATTVVALAGSFAANAQKVATVDTKEIMERMPEYKTVQTTIEQTAATWQKEIDTKQTALDRAYKEYDAQQDMMSATLKKTKEEDLFKKEKELRDLQKKRFGFEGELFKKRLELMQPIQTKLSNAIQNITAKNSYDLVIDKSEGKTIIFANPKLDISAEVLRELGIK